MHLFSALRHMADAFEKINEFTSRDVLLGGTNRS